MSKQIVMGCTVEELEAVGISDIGCLEWAFYLIKDMDIINQGDSLYMIKQWESEGAENIGNDLSRLTTKKKESGYVELDVVVSDCGIYLVNGVDDDGYFGAEYCLHLSDCPNIVGFGGILFEGVESYTDLCPFSCGQDKPPKTPLKARFWREG